MASQLVGAWTAPGRGPLAMPAEIRAAMLAPCRGDDRVIEGEHFWMTGSIRERSVESAAAVGFVARRPLLGDDPPEGNYALARVDAGGRLVLTRSVSGGERLYYTVHEQTVLFSSSLRPLLAHPAMSREVHVPTLKDVLLILLDMLLFHTEVRPAQMLGFALTVLGVRLYGEYKSDRKRFASKGLVGVLVDFFFFAPRRRGRGGSSGGVLMAATEEWYGASPGAFQRRKTYPYPNPIVLHRDP